MISNKKTLAKLLLVIITLTLVTALTGCDANLPEFDNGLEIITSGLGIILCVILAIVVCIIVIVVGSIGGIGLGIFLIIIGIATLLIELVAMLGNIIF